MAGEKFAVGEAVEVFCRHVRDGRRLDDWLAGVVVQVDHRMAAVRFEAEVFSTTGWPIPDRTLWCAHGSRKIRRLEVVR